MLQPAKNYSKLHCMLMSFSMFFSNINRFQHKWKAWFVMCLDMAHLLLLRKCMFCKIFPEKYEKSLGAMARMSPLQICQ